MNKKKEIIKYKKIKLKTAQKEKDFFSSKLGKGIVFAIFTSGLILICNESDYIYINFIGIALLIISGILYTGE